MKSALKIFLFLFATLVLISFVVFGSTTYRLYVHFLSTESTPQAKQIDNLIKLVIPNFQVPGKGNQEENNEKIKSTINLINEKLRNVNGKSFESIESSLEELDPIPPEKKTQEEQDGGYAIPKDDLIEGDLQEKETMENEMMEDKMKI